VFPLASVTFDTSIDLLKLL